MGNFSIKTGALKSHTTGRLFPFIKDPDGASKALAARQLAADDARFLENQKQRQALEPPEVPKTETERIRSETYLLEKNKPHGNPDRALAERLAHQQNELKFAKTPADRARAKKRIADLQDKIGARELKAAAEAKREALEQSPAVQKALTAAQKRYDDLSSRPDIPDSIVQRAKANLESLQESLDSSTFDAADALLVGSYQAHKQGKINALKEQIAKSERELGLVKSDTPPPTPPAENIAPPTGETSNDD